MKLPTVNKFLCCLDLHVGGYVIGIFASVMAIIGAILLITVLVLLFVAYDSLNVDGGEWVLIGK